MKGKIVVAALASVFAGNAFGIESPRPADRKQDWGINVGAYFPVDSEIRDQFGDALLRIGISPISRKFDKDRDITTDVNILWAEEDDSKLLLIPFTVGLTMGFGPEGSRSYVSINGGPAYADYRLFRVVDSGGEGLVLQEYKDRTITWNINAEIGWMITPRFAITGRYDWFPKHDGFDFSGYSFFINYTFFRW